MEMTIAGKQWRHKNFHVRNEEEVLDTKSFYIRNPHFQVSRLPENETQKRGKKLVDFFQQKNLFLNYYNCRRPGCVKYTELLHFEVYKKSVGFLMNLQETKWAQAVQKVRSASVADMKEIVLQGWL